MVSKDSRNVSNTRFGFILYVSAISSLNSFAILSGIECRDFRRVLARLFDLIIFTYAGI